MTSDMARRTPAKDGVRSFAMIPAIEKDKAPYRLLVGEYPMVKEQ